MKNSSTVVQVAALIAMAILGLAAVSPAQASTEDDISGIWLAKAMSGALLLPMQYFNHPPKHRFQSSNQQWKSKIHYSPPATVSKPQILPTATYGLQGSAPAPGIQLASQKKTVPPTKVLLTNLMRDNKLEHDHAAFFSLLSSTSLPTPWVSPSVATPGDMANSSALQTDGHPSRYLYRLIQAVIANNANIRLASQSLRSADAGSLQAIGGFLPHLRFQAQSQMYVNTSGLPTASLVGSNIIETQGNIYSNYMSIMASLNLFEGGSGIESLSAAHQGIVAARGEILHQQNRAVLDLLVTFQQMQNIHRQEIIMRKAISLAKQDLSLNEQKFRHGDESVLELNKARVLLLQYQSQCDDLRKRLLKTQTQLTALLGKQGAFELVREAEHEKIPQPPKAGKTAMEIKEYKEIVNKLPTVVTDLAEMREARHQAASIRGSFLPDVNFQAGYNWLGTSSHGFGPAFNNINRNNYTIGLTITQSLGPFTGHLAKLHTAEAKLESARIRYQQALLVGHQQLRVDREEIQTGNQQVKTLRKEYVSAKKDLQLIAALYKHGRVSKMDLHIATFRALNAQEAWQAARGELVVARWMFYAMLSPREVVHALLKETLDSGS